MTATRSVQQVLVLHAGALGDCVLTLHLIEAVKRSWGSPHITLAARSPIAQWAQKHGLIAEACALEALPMHQLYHQCAVPADETVRFLQRFDRVVSFLGGLTEEVSVRLSAILGKNLIAIDPNPTEATLRDGVHITQQWADELTACGCAVHLRWSADGATIDLAGCDRIPYNERLAGRLGVPLGRIALCHPGSGGLQKCCPLEVLERLVGAFTAAGWSVGWIIGPDEMEQFGPSYLERLHAWAPVIYEESVEAAAELICGATAYVGSDAGMTHVAALAGVRAVAIFGPTDPRVWGPLGPRCEVIPRPNGIDSADPWVRDVLRRVSSAE